jgi:hypothetical protein
LSHVNVAQDPENRWYANEPFFHPEQTNWDVNPWLFPRNDARLFIDDDDLSSPLFPEMLTEQDLWDVLAGETVDGASFTADDAAEAVKSAHSFAILFNPNGSISRTD